MNILIVENDLDTFNSLSSILLHQCGIQAVNTATGEACLGLLKETEFDLVISNHLLSDMTSLSLLERINALKLAYSPKVILISSSRDSQMLIEAFRMGVYDIILTPMDPRYLIRCIQDMLLNSPNEAGTGHQQQQNIPEPDPMAMENVFDLHGIGKVGFFSKEMQDLMGKAIKLHENKSSAVLIQGETGTGKEIIASLIHYGKNCPPAEETPLICVNCSAISPNLFESEFFGYEGGAFTGADPKGKAGKLELAANGTLFLDEIADMPLDFQPKLLRVLEDRRFFRISGNKELSFNARVICATNNHLLEMVNNGKFRKDLYYRLNTAILQIPPLRERKDDIIPLAYLFLEEFRPKDSKKLSTITEGAREILQNLKWDGNIRELHSTMERIAFNYNDSFLQAAHVESMVDEYVEGNKNFFYLELSEEGVNLQEVIDLFISRVIDMHNGNITKTAEYLKTSRNLVKRRGGK